MPKFAYSTLACPTWDWEQIVANGIRYGYDGVEIRQVGGEVDLLQVLAFAPARRRRTCEFLKTCPRPAGCVAPFAVCGLASSVRFDYPQQNERDEQFDIGKAHVELAAELEAGFVRVFGDVLPHDLHVARDAAIEQIADELNRLGEFAAGYKIDILLETHGDFAESPTVQELFAKIESPRVGVLWDTHHPWRFFNETPESTLANLRPWLRHTHWKDSITLPDRAALAAFDQASPAEQEAHALMSGHRHADYVLFGGGEFPIEHFAALLKRAGYDGWLSLEWEKMWHPELADPEVALPLFAQKIRSFWSQA